ncbi:hypothetical protein CBER1_09681 [Cercospora berteroae]|uniref:EF-hand domain-containing protein n=1 Tax=Cercospora berteroae TaxID=357750 RepID=A0A2S6BWT9_9PEZI|nr:hypothetical protein CBER1_09681 [Cercospora berteroae]
MKKVHAGTAYGAASSAVCRLFLPPPPRSNKIKTFTRRALIDAFQIHDKDGEMAISVDDWMGDLRLLRHFVVTTTLEPVGATKNVQRLWRDVVSEEATRHPLLNEQLSQPMFTLASVISISSVARSCAIAFALPEPRYVSMEQVTELFLLTRGVSTIVDACVLWLRSSPLAPVLVGYEIPDREQVTLPDSVSERFHVLDQMIDTACFGEHQKNVCKDALMALADVYRSVAYFSAKNQLQTGKTAERSICIQS